MARDNELRTHLTADDDASKVIDKVADKASALEDEDVEVTVGADTKGATHDIDGLLAKVDKLGAGDAANILLTSNAVKVGGEITDLIGDLDRLDAADPQVDVKVDQIQQLTGELDQIQAKAKEINGTPINLDTGPATGGVDKLSDSARGANSALANMIGNSAQDLGAVSGVAGSAGVAIGQIAEGFADATLSGEGFASAIRGIATALGPIAALTLIVGTITNLLGEQAAEAEASTKRVQQFGDAMSGASDDALGLADSLRANQDELRKFDAAGEGFGAGIEEGLAQVARSVPILGGLVGDAGQNITDLIPIMKAAGFSIYDLGTAIKQGGLVGQDWTHVLLDAVKAGKISTDQYGALSEAIATYGNETRTAAQNQDVFNVQADEANAILQDLTTQADPLQKMGNSWATLMADMADGTINTTQAADAINALANGLGLTQEEVIKLAQGQLDKNMETAAAATEKAATAAQDYAEVLASTDWKMSGIDAAVTTFERLGEAQFGLLNISANTQAAYDDLNAAVAKNGFTFDVATEAGRANAEQIQNLYSSLIPQLSAAFTDAGGSVTTFGQNMDALRAGVFQQLSEQTSLTGDQINAVIDQLGVFDGSKYSSEFELLGTEDATTKLGLLSGVLSSLPDQVQKQVALDVIAGDPQAALATIEASIRGTPIPPAVIPSELDPSGAESGAQGFANSTQPTATVPLDADPSKAASETSGFVQKTEATKPVINVGASVTQALITMAIINAIAQAMAPTVTVSANTSPVYDALGAVSRSTTRAPVDAYLHDYPTNTEIAGRIGVVRVPVDTYLRNTARIEGAG